MIKLLIGGSPCTHWSIAQSKCRETEPSGIGWELFENYLIALNKFQPKYFLYENNKSMSQAIKQEITRRFGFESICINSALVSAQNRQRLYWCGMRNSDGTYSRVDVQQPKDKGILLRDILETGLEWNEKGCCLAASRGGHCLQHDFVFGENNYAAEPVNACGNKSRTLKAQYAKNGVANFITNNGFDATGVAETIRVGTKPNHKGKIADCQSMRIYSVEAKSRSLTAGSGGNGTQTGLYAIPINTTRDCKAKCLRSSCEKDGIRNMICNEVDKRTCVAVPLNCAADRTAGCKNCRTVYEVNNGLVTIKNKRYPIKLPDGYYVIRKLTVTECKRLQTVPDAYEFPVSDTQAYKMLGNGWTVDVICHLMSHFDGIATEQIDVLSMYDGMACGHIALDKIGAQIFRYRATEIDKYAIKTSCHNFSDIEQLGDAFRVREDDWNLL